MSSSFLHGWCRRAGSVIADLSKRSTLYLEEFPRPAIQLLDLDRPVEPIPGTRRASHKRRSRRPRLDSAEACLSESAAVAVSIGYEGRSQSSSMLAHSINMALCKDSFTGTMRGFDFERAPSSWEDFLARTSHVWSPEFSGFLRKRARKTGREVGERSYRGWTEVVVRNVLELFDDMEGGAGGLAAFEPMAEPRS